MQVRCCGDRRRRSGGLNARRSPELCGALVSQHTASRRRRHRDVGPSCLFRTCRRPLADFKTRMKFSAYNESREQMRLVLLLALVTSVVALQESVAEFLPAIGLEKSAVESWRASGFSRCSRATRFHYSHIERLCRSALHSRSAFVNISALCFASAWKVAAALFNVSHLNAFELQHATWFPWSKWTYG